MTPSHLPRSKPITRKQLAALSGGRVDGQAWSRNPLRLATPMGYCGGRAFATHQGLVHHICIQQANNGELPSSSESLWIIYRYSPNSEHLQGNGMNGKKKSSLQSSSSINTQRDIEYLRAKNPRQGPIPIFWEPTKRRASSEKKNTGGGGNGVVYVGHWTCVQVEILPPGFCYRDHPRCAAVTFQWQRFDQRWANIIDACWDKSCRDIGMLDFQTDGRVVVATRMEPNEQLNADKKPAAVDTGIETSETEKGYGYFGDEDEEEEDDYSDTDDDDEDYVDKTYPVRPTSAGAKRPARVVNSRVPKVVCRREPSTEPNTVTPIRQQRQEMSSINPSLSDPLNSASIGISRARARHSEQSFQSDDGDLDDDDSVIVIETRNNSIDRSTTRATANPGHDVDTDDDDDDSVIVIETFNTSLGTSTARTRHRQNSNQSNEDDDDDDGDADDDVIVIENPPVASCGIFHHPQQRREDRHIEQIAGNESISRRCQRLNVKGEEEEVEEQPLRVSNAARSGALNRRPPPDPIRMKIFKVVVHGRRSTCGAGDYFVAVNSNYVTFRDIRHAIASQLADVRALPLDGYMFRVKRLIIAKKQETFRVDYFRQPGDEENDGDGSVAHPFVVTIQEVVSVR